MELTWVIGISLAAVSIIYFEWRGMNKNQKKEKFVALTLTMIGWTIGCLLVYFPDLPGPSDLLNIIFRPFKKILQ